MTQLDRHVTTVRTKLALGTFVRALAWVWLVWFSLVLLLVLADRFFRFLPTHQLMWTGIGAGVSMAGAIVYAIVRRPTSTHAAIAIDQKLSLKEKFSTALSLRSSQDPFAQLVIRDAERAAASVSMHKQFPLPFPRVSYATLAVMLSAALVATLVKPMDLFGRVEAEKKKVELVKASEDAKKNIERALATVEAVARASGDNEQIKQARNELADLLKTPINDPAKARLTAAKALSDVSEAVKQQVKKSQKFASARSDSKAFKSLQPPEEQDGPVAKAHNALAKGEFNKAVQNLKDAGEKFDQMTPEEQKKAAEQMKNLAQQLQQMAQDPNAQKTLENKMKELGADPKQAKEIAEQIQKAAGGDKEAQKQLQQMQQQLQDQLTNNPGLTKEQQQAMQDMVQNAMQQAQAQANTQQTAQNLAEAGMKMADAMQQMAGQNPQQQGQQDQQAQQMSDAQQAMQDQLQQMDAVAKDAQQQAAAQQAAAQAAADAAQGMNGQGKGQGGQGQGQPGDAQAKADGQGEWREGDPNGKQGGGAGGAGQGEGDRSNKQAAPFAVKQEFSPTENDEKGRILASTFVKAGSIKGESKAELQQALEASEKEATDEVDQERVSRQNQKIVREYFESMQEDAR